MKKEGFTLAEVLITIAIVGVVAAITIPIVSVDINKRANMTKAKSVATDLEIAYGNALIDDDEENIADTKLATLTDTDGFEALQKYMVVTKDKDENNKDVIKTKNGACIFQNNSEITIDANCTDKPNKVGVDKFKYTRNSNGTLSEK
ncbi:MAG: type II secretion system GspH family protein [bacterium]|nr:type II secretion system GspH family protein [bacterium]